MPNTLRLGGSRAGHSLKTHGQSHEWVKRIDVARFHSFLAQDIPLTHFEFNFIGVGRFDFKGYTSIE